MKRAGTLWFIQWDREGNVVRREFRASEPHSAETAKEAWTAHKALESPPAATRLKRGGIRREIASDLFGDGK